MDSNIFRIVIALILSNITMVGAFAMPQRDTRPSQQLIDEAMVYIEGDSLVENAVALLSEVSNRYYEHPEDLACRVDAVKAMTELGKLYSVTLFDYPKAYRNLTTAKMIAEELSDHKSLSRIYMMLANLCVMCGDSDARNLNNVDSLLHLAVQSGLKGQDELSLVFFAINVAQKMKNKGGWGRHTDDILSIKNYNFSSPTIRSIALGVIEGMDAYFAQDYERAIDVFSRLLQEVPADQQDGRYENGIIRMLQVAYEANGDYDAEEALLRHRLANAIDDNQLDYELFSYIHLSNFFERREMADSAQHYYIKYLMLKDKMDSQMGLSSVVNIEMLDKIEEVNDEIRVLSLDKMRAHRRLLVASGIVIVILVSAIVLLILFVSLRRSHRVLYRQNCELLETQERYQMLLKDHTEQASRQESKDNDENTDENLKEVYAKILYLMDNTDDIYRYGFNLEMLAAMLHIGQREVSQAINRCAGKNFHQLLNDYRIREACRIMPQVDPRVHTIETIADKVGFKSRTSFATLFRKTTGLTPSEYWKMSREGK
ncbi:MAG: helix-turn-helix domain-containing protein [Muribaculaceae bacterium]